MLFSTLGDPKAPAILFFHAMGVTGDSSRPVAEYLKDRYFCILPTATPYCPGQVYRGKADELRQLTAFLRAYNVQRLALTVASSIGADLAMAFLAEPPVPVDHAFFDGGQFAQISRPLRRIMAPLLYLAIRSLYWSKGKTLKWIMWCDDESIRPYFIAAGSALTYGNLRRQLLDSLEDKPFPALSEDMQRRCTFAFGSIEDHYKYRDAVIRAYPAGDFPVFPDCNHMQLQIREPQRFAAMLADIIRKEERIENNE